MANGSDSDANAADDGMDDDIDEHSNSKQSGLSSKLLSFPNYIRFIMD